MGGSRGRVEDRIDDWIDGRVEGGVEEGGWSTESRVRSTEGEAGDAEVHGPAGTLVRT